MCHLRPRRTPRCTRASRCSTQRAKPRAEHEVEIAFAPVSMAKPLPSPLPPPPRHTQAQQLAKLRAQVVEPHQPATNSVTRTPPYTCILTESAVSAGLLFFYPTVIPVPSPGSRPSAAVPCSPGRPAGTAVPVPALRARTAGSLQSLPALCVAWAGATSWGSGKGQG